MRGATFQAGSRDLFLLADTTRKVSVNYEAGLLSADSSIHFNREDMVEARGRPVLTPPSGEPVESRRLLVNARTRQASAFGAETRYEEGAVWHVVGDLPRIQQNLVYATHARFTSCTLEVPHFHFGSNRVKVVRGNMLVAAPVQLVQSEQQFWPCTRGKLVVVFIAQAGKDTR